MKYFHLLALLMMLAFAALQWNDPDAAIWITIYVCCAILALIAYKRICTPCITVWAILVLLFSIYLFSLTSDGIYQIFEHGKISELFEPMQENKPYIENTREVLGLVIIWLYILITLLSLFFAIEPVKNEHS